MRKGRDGEEEDECEDANEELHDACVTLKDGPGEQMPVIDMLSVCLSYGCG